MDVCGVIFDRLGVKQAATSDEKDLVQTGAKCPNVLESGEFRVHY